MTIGSLGLGLLALQGASTLQTRRLRAELERVRQMMDGGRLAVAREKLVSLAQHWPADGDVLFLLGRCEETLGRPDRALDAWGRIPVSSPEFARGAESRGSLLINQGQFAPAETLLFDSVRRVRETDRYPLLRALARLLRLEGRYGDVSDVLTAAWLHAPDRSQMLTELWQNDNEPVPVDGWKALLDAADQSDDRVWLGKARHAILTDRFD